MHIGAYVLSPKKRSRCISAEDLSVVKAGYFHRLSQGLQVGAQITFPGKVEQGHKSTNEFALAVQHNTKDHRSMKLKFDYNGTEGM